MKVRIGFVSNSSSASFLILNWFDLSPRKRAYIQNYDINALKVLKKHRISYTIENWEGFSKRAPFKGKVITTHNWPYSEEWYSFGCLNDGSRYHFTENKKDNTCLVDTSMDNFWMDKWLEYNKVTFEERE